MAKRAITVSRYQPFHIGHLQTVRDMKKDGYEEIIVGIGSAEKSKTPENPFNCSERMEMVHAVLKEEGFKHYFIVPIRDLGDYDLWMTHVERLVPKFDAVYEGNPQAADLFREKGYKIVEQKRKTVTDFKKNPPEAIEVSGTEIRKMILNDDYRWKKLGPPQGGEKKVEYNGADRIKSLNKMLYK
jgi:nicotinamide-nucleotide adenylyltransferase